MANVFTYGTLMWPQAMYAVTSKNYQHIEGTLHGYQRMHIKNRVYPGLVKNPQQKVKGVIYLNVGPEELDYLHGYECQYDPIDVTVVTQGNQSLKAVAYLYKNLENLEDRIWDPQIYAQQYKT